MASLALHLLTVVLGVIFVFLGNVKLTPQFFPEYHNQARNEFGKLNKEFPLYQQTGWRPYAKNYRIAVAVAEMSAGSLLILGGAISRSMANIVLLLVMVNFVIAFQKLNYSFEYMAGAIVLTVLLLLRFFLASRETPVRTRPTKKPTEQKAE